MPDIEHYALPTGDERPCGETGWLADDVPASNASRKEATMMDWGDSAASSWWWMLPMMLFLLVLTGAVLWRVIAVVRSTTSGGTATTPTADQILAERFARGEIDAGGYHERIEALHAVRRTVMKS